MTPSLATLALLPSLLAPVQDGPPVDAYGDSLAPGVVARFGSPRLLHDGKITGVALSADGNVVATGTQAGTVRVASTIDGALLFEMPLPGGGVRSLSISANGERVAAGSTEGFSVVWDVATGAQIARIDGGELVELSPDASRAAISGADDEVRVVALDVDRETVSAEGPGYLPTTLRYSPDGRLVAKTSWNRARLQADGDELPAARLEVYAVESGELLWERTWAERDLQRPSFTGGGAELVVLAPDGVLERYRADSGEPLDDGPAIDDTVYAVAAGSRIAAISSQNRLVVHTRGEDELTQIPVGTGRVTAFDLSADGRVLASGVGIELLLHDLEEGKPLASFDRHVGPVGSIAVAPGGDVVATGGYDGGVRLWEPATGLALDTFVAAGPRVFTVDVSADGRRLAAVDYEGRVRIWDIGSGELVRELAEEGVAFTALDFAPVGSDLACLAATGQLVVLDAESGQERLRRLGFSGVEFTVAWAADGRRLAVGSSELIVLDVDSGGELRRWTRLGSPLNALVWNPDGTRLAAGFAAKVIRIYDPAAEQPVHELRGHAGRVTALAFAPDGTRLYSTSYGDELVRVWDPRNGDEKPSIHSPGGQLLSIAVLPDGRQLVVGGLDPVARVLSVPR